MCIDVLTMCFDVRPPPLDGAILSDIIEKDDVARDQAALSARLWVGLSNKTIKRKWLAELFVGLKLKKTAKGA